MFTLCALLSVTVFTICASVVTLQDKLSPGAGGGGFVVLLTKEPSMADKVKAVIQENRVFNFYIDFFFNFFYLSNLHRPLKN